jgi:hypothetical protein
MLSVVVSIGWSCNPDRLANFLAALEKREAVA